VNLRLTDEQHAELIEMAKREDRSLQREIIYRLFGRFNQEPAAIVRTSADAESRDVRARTLETPSGLSVQEAIAGAKGVLQLGTLPHVDPRGEVEPDFKPQKKR
jgi:hypothetical protein